MSLLTRLHAYAAGGLLKSSDWNDELNQIFKAIGYTVALGPFNIVIAGFSDDPLEGILELNNLGTGDLLSLQLNGGTTLFATIKNNGQWSSDIIGGEQFRFTSALNPHLRIANLNVARLGGRTLSTSPLSYSAKLFIYETVQNFYVGLSGLTFPYKPVWVCGLGGATITKLKAKQDVAVASGDAVTTITYKVNGTSIGTITINGNNNTVQTNDIADLPIVAGDKLEAVITTYTGTTKHQDITCMFHLKKKVFQ